MPTEDCSIKTKICPQCNSPFLFRIQQAKTGGGKYCSHDCYAASMVNPRIPRICKICGNPFLALRGKVCRGGARYCSRLCAYQGRIKTPIEIRFWKYVQKTDTCWIWIGSKRGGYGLIALNRKVRSTSAHRVSWEIHYGKIPDGLQVLHMCDNRACVNPGHLFIGTNADNMADKVAKGRQSAKRTRHQILEIRRLRNMGLTHRAIGDMLGIPRTSVGPIARGNSWGQVH